MIDILDNSVDKSLSVIPDYEEFYGFGLPIETGLGAFHPIKVKDYPAYLIYLQNIKAPKEKIIQEYRKLNKGEKVEKIFEQMEKLSLFEFVLNDKNTRYSYEVVLNKCFEREGVLDEIKDEDTFDYYRGLVLKTSAMKEEKVNPNPEIQKFIEMSKQSKSKGQETFTISDMLSSVSMMSGIDYGTIMEWSIYQLHLSYHRIIHIINYDTGNLFKTVSIKEIEVDDWNKHIDLLEEEKHGIHIKELGKIAQTIK